MTPQIKTTTIKILAALLAVFFLSSCKQGPGAGANILPSNTGSQQQVSEAPVRLGGRKQPEQGPSVNVRMAVDPQKARRAIENYRVNRKAKPGPYKYAGADLNGDGQPEILVLYTGEGWCARTGCTLVVLAPTSNHAYESISIVRRVKTPIHVGSTSSHGWRDIHIRTGLADWPKSHKVVLQFSGRGYPGNAVMLTPLPRRTKIEGDEVFGAPTLEEIELMKHAAAASQ